jgi:NAD(P)-dependent dehydrogenase (short-subunit alcohol dehydrogenase family)
MTRQFEGKVALVTGGSSGIGLATALAFSREGAKVVIADVQEGNERKVSDLIRREGGQAVFHECDVSQSYQVRNVVEMILENFGRLDFACNNAGIEGTQVATADSDEAQWSRILEVNLTGTYLCMKHEIPAMLRNGGGAIVNISSIAGLAGFAGMGAYVSSKHGMLGLTKTAALEYATRGIRVNAICPGVIQTPMIERLLEGDPGLRAQLTAGSPMGRFGRPEEIAAAVTWLCSTGSSYATGQHLTIDGGWSAQ